MVQLRRRTMLDGSALFAVILTSYFSLTLGGIEWLIAANLFLIFYSLFARFNQSLQRNSHSIAAFWSVAALPMLILIAYQFWPNEQLTQLWIVAFATHLSLTSLARNDHRLKAKKFYFALIALCEGVGLVVLPLHLSPFDYPLIANATIAILKKIVKKRPIRPRHKKHTNQIG